MGSCFSKKKGSSFSQNSKSASSTVPELKNNPSVSCVKVEPETAPEVKLKKDNIKKVEEKHVETLPEPEGHVKKEIFIIKHRKSHDDRERNSNSNSNSTAEQMGGMLGVRTSSCTKEEVDAILIQCGRLSRSSSGNAVAAAASGEHRRRYSGSKRSYDFDHCDNDTISNDDDSKKGNNANENINSSDLCEDERHQHRPRHRHSPSRRASSQERRRRTPSREREQQQRSNSRERRVSRSPGRRSSENTIPSTARHNNGSRPGKMVSVPPTVSSLVMDKSNNNGVGVGGESAAATGIKRITVKRNAGAASPRSQSPARANNGNAANGNKAFNDNQQQPSLSRSSSRKAEQSPYKRNPLSEIEPNSLAFPHSTTNSSSSRVQNRPKKEFEAEPNQKTNGSRTALESVNCMTKVQQEEDVKVQSSITDNIVVKTMVPPPVVDNPKPHTLTRSMSSRRSRDLDLNPEVLLNPPPSYASLLLEDIQNFHQKSTQPVSLPACVTKACSILEAVADLNSNTSLNFCGTEDRRSPPAFQCSRNDYNVPMTNDYGKREPDAEYPVVESMLVFNDDDVMEPSLHKYVRVNRGGSLGGGVDMDDQESSGSNSFTVSSGQQLHWGVSSSSWEPSSVESKDCWTSRSNYSKEEGHKSPLGLDDGRVASGAGCGAGGATKKLNSQRRECDHQHGSGIGRGRLGANKVLRTIPASVATAAAST